MWIALLVIYLGGLVYILGSGSDMARDPKRFWPGLLFWPVIAIAGAIDAVLDRL